MIELFLVFIFYHYHRIEEEHIQHNLLLEMQKYSVDFNDARFNIDIIPVREESLYTLHEEHNSFYILVPFGVEGEDILKIYYSKTSYENSIHKLHYAMVGQFIFLSLIASFLALFAAIYSLKPLRDALRLLEDFMKDIIHDLNTPISAIVLNLKMIKEKDEKINIIAHATNNIAMVHQNLDAYLQETHTISKPFTMKKVIEEQIAFFMPMYDYLTWDVQLENKVLYSNVHAFSRIIYNLFSNACKYNVTSGYIKISTNKNEIIIVNDSYGIKHPEKIFDRFYKESERGLGIGLHIVQKLAKELSIGVDISVKGTQVTCRLDISKIHQK